jgi:hypothetical protein
MTSLAEYQLFNDMNDDYTQSMYLAAASRADEID